MSARLRGIAKETEQIVAAGGYTSPGDHPVRLAPWLAEAAEGTRLYGPGPVEVAGDVAAPGDRSASRTRFEVTPEGSLGAARRLSTGGGAAYGADARGADGAGTALADGTVAVLNFASARNPGGGYLNGAQAQEEALCRGSALYASLRRVPEFYAAHRADPSPFYSDRVVYSPGVAVFRDDGGALLDEPYRVAFLTSAAPNAGVIAQRDPAAVSRVPRALASRAERVLEVAAAHGHRHLVLGAWGCGVFRNDPAQVAGAFRALLTGEGRFAGRFDHVVFAVLDRRADSPTRAAFAAAFGPRPGGATDPA
ncbi:TIGR02452 family protein [Streptomyces sp. AC563]|uniref:TIGR02452 family protein n=1 Tax=Streptomyces buecherae TaxID=2763006 RepID=UPI00164E6B55|nr:TIGR02452 family protein [Streptomyces buecherae]MBC3989565.1 TIGR02452 family protein [Streptomyces buecherae]